MLASLQDQARNGIIPSREDLAKFDSYALSNYYGILNLPDKYGHTLLNYVVKSPDSFERRKFLKLLDYRGAQLTAHDKYHMGPQALFRALLNLPLEASAKTTVKVFRTFVTKNTEDKLQHRASSFKMSGQQVEERHNKVAEVKKTFGVIKDDLLTARQKEQVQAQKDKQMPAY
ncbi:MAG TPA: hypothetical protein VJJ26_03525 [Candidatus Babeliales bacterium]|nr:hypothetical protein [Candidatus Babeliales bacterium]